MAKACPIDAAMSIAPEPTFSMCLFPSGDVAKSRAKNITYPMILIIPYATSEAPKSKYFMIKTRMKRTRQLARGLAIEY